MNRASHLMHRSAQLGLYRDDRAYDEADSAIDTLQKTIALIVGFIVSLLLARFVLILIGANPLKTFADLIYHLSNPFVAGLRNLLGYQVTYGIGRIEVETVVAIVGYVLAGWLLVRFLDFWRRDLASNSTI